LKRGQPHSAAWGNLSGSPVPSLPPLLLPNFYFGEEQVNVEKFILSF
jgi:hypothetical protein